MSAAELVLAAFPNVLLAIENYRNFIEPLKDIRNYRGTLKEIKTHVFIQKEKMSLTFRQHLQLDKPTKEQLTERLQALYPANAAEFLDIIDRMESVLHKISDKLDVDSNGQVGILLPSC